MSKYPQQSIVVNCDDMAGDYMEVKTKTRCAGLVFTSRETEQDESCCTVVKDRESLLRIAEMILLTLERMDDDDRT